MKSRFGEVSETMYAMVQDMSRCTLSDVILDNTAGSAQQQYLRDLSLNFTGPPLLLLELQSTPQEQNN